VGTGVLLKMQGELHPELVKVTEAPNVVVPEIE
jgi:hypothetical protein